MVDTARPPLSAEDEIANALRDSTFQDVTAVAQDRGNDRADQELQQDLANMTQLQLRAKYGDRVALNRNRLIDGRNRLTESDEASRTIGEAISDTAFAFGNSVYRGIGTLSNLAYGYAEGALDGDPNTTGAGQAAKYLDAHNQVVAIMQQVTLSDQLKERQRFEGIASELDKEDSANQAAREIEEGADPFWAGLRQQGRDAINALERNASDPMLAGNIIADGVGSLVSSAPLAGAGGLIAKGASQALVKNVLAQRVALAAGTSAGAGVSEVSSVYAQAASDVMSIDTNRLLESSTVMQGLVAEGLTPEEAKIQLAGMTAETAAIRQMAPALALGFITSRFERMPLGAFADSGIAKGMLQIAGEGLEEAGQEFSGAVNQNIAVEQFAQIGRAALEGAGEQAALGMLGGLGMAGVSATPAAAVGTVRRGVDAGRAAADALFNETKVYDEQEVKDIENKNFDRRNQFNESMRTFANDRLDQINKDIAGTEDITLPDGTVVKGSPGKYITPEQQNEKEFLKKALVTNDYDLIAETYGFNEFTALTPNYTVKPSPAARAAAMASDLAGKAKEQAISVASTVSQSEAVAKAVDTVKTKDAKIAQKVSQEALDVSQTVADDMASGSYTDDVVNSVAPETTTGSYAGLEGGNVFDTVAAISAKAAEKGFRPTAEDTQYANAQIQRLRQVAGSLSPRAKRQVAGLLSSKFIEKVEAEATKLDLNKETPTGEVTPQEVETTVNVASSNPANVNPERVNKILEESGENITPLKNKILKVASAVSGSVNRNAEAQVEISRGEQIGLTQNGEKAGKAKSIKDTTRSILADGWTDRNGKSLRSVNDFAADLIKGIQSPDGTVVDKQGRPSKVQAVAEQFNNFAQHMVNRVNALNESFDSNYVSQKTGKLVGRGVKFRGLANGTKWYEADDPQNYFSPLAYHRGDPNSIALAQQVEADTIATVEALNAFKQEFPELFQGMPDVVVPVLKREGDQTPTAIDEDTPQAVSEEQNQQTQEESLAPAEEATSTSEIKVNKSIYDTETTTNVRLTAQDLLDEQLAKGDSGNIGGIDLINDREGRIQTVKDVTNAILGGAKKAPKQITRAQQILADYLFEVLKKELNDQQNPTAIEEDGNSEGGAGETGANATDETVTTEEIASEEQQKDVFALPEDVDVADSQMKKEINIALKAILSQYLNKSVIGFLFENIRGYFTIYDPNIDGSVHSASGLSMVGWNHAIMQNLLNGTLNEEDLHAVLHEIGHVFDTVFLKTQISDDGTVVREWFAENKYVQEANKFVLHPENQNSKMSDFLTSYALRQETTYKIKSELFAEMFALALKNIGKLKNDLPETAKFFEEFIERITQESDYAFGSEGTRQEGSLVTDEEQITDDSTEEEIRGWMNNPEAWSEADRTRVNEKAKDLVKASKDLIAEYFGENVAKRLHRVIVYPANKALGPGYVHVSDDGKTREIYISDTLMKDGKLTKLGKAVVLHEMAHIVDFTNYPDFISAQNTFQPGGAIYQEALFLEAHSPWVKDRMDYANNYKGDDPVSHRAELFAVMSEFYFSKDGSILENSPAILTLMEEVYGPRTRSETTGVTTDDEQTSTNESPAEGTGSGAVEEVRTRKVNPKFSKVFKEKNTEGHPKNLGEFLTKIQESGVMNTETLEFVKTLAPLLRNLLNARLNDKVTDNKVKKSILDHIKDGRTLFRRFKTGLLVDPETGRYDDDMVDLAAVAVADWLITNKGSDPRKLDDTLEKLGLSIHDINDEDHMSVMLGVPPANAADGLASDILRMWDVSADNEAQTDAIHGIAQGFAKEIFTVLSNDPNTNYLTVEPLTIKRDDRKVKTETILVNSDEMKAVRQKVLAANESGMKLTAKEVMFNETRPIYSIGTKIPSVASRQNRSSVQLSNLERRALQKMQDTPNYLDEGMATIIANLGEGVLQEILGYRFDVEEIQNPVLRRSVRGKNASILADIDEIIALGGNDSLTADTPVYFPVGITKVGRHQYQGPNPQSNKLMRSLITPTWSTVSVANLNNFWLAVGQASDIKGINKAEKLSHADIVKKAPEVFYAKYGDAVKQIKSLIQSGTMDQDALKQALGVVEPQQLKAVLAVAQLEIAVENGDSTFRTSLSFELDGLTNGVANMMINFGQGELTDEDYWNFQRVGFFPGKKNQTVNKYFAQVGALDMYETVARLGDQMLKLAQGSNSQRDWQKEQKKAAIRLAAVIGNFDPETGNMSRNTAKNPMTKVNYGSGVKGVAVGVADDMLLEFYKQLEVKPENVKMDDYFYPGFTKDMNALGINVNDTSNKSFVAYPDQVEKFRTAIQYSIGNVLTDATKETIGSKINDLNDLMVLSTNLQSKYLQAMYDKKVSELGEKLAKDGVIERTKDGAPKLAQIPQKYFRALEKELMQMSPIFVSDEQTLAIGGFEKRLSSLLTSSNYDEKLAQKALMPQPDDVGVKSIPFTVIGTGDAMMMNLIFGNENAPNDVLGIFDGLDIPLEKIQEYAPFVNEQVAKSWDRDVLSMAIANFDGFLSHPDLDQTVLAETLDGLMQENKKESLNGMDSPEKIQKSLQERLRENQARKAVFKQLAISVDQMGGSDIGFTREGEEVGLIEINHRIRRLLEQKPQKVDNDVKEPVLETTVKELYMAMKLNQKQLDVLELVQARSQDTRVIMGTVEQLRVWMEQNTPDSANVLLDVKGAYDPVNNIMYLTSKNPETFIHEVIHATTFNKVLEHYEGNKNKWVQNIENLMNEFLAIDSKGQNVMNAQAAILRHVNQTNPFRKAAALNEFMAWSLSNQHVRDKLKSTETSTLKSLAAKVVKLMQRMFGGIVPTDMYSALTFNTALLMNPSLEEKFADGTGGNGDGGDNGGNGNGGDGGERTPLGNNMTNYWIETLEKWIDTQDTTTETGNRRLRNLALDQANADRVMDTLRQAGLLRNALDRQTFRAIYGILKSEMILDPNSLIALTKVFQHVEANMTPEMFGSGSEAANTYSAVLNSFGSFQRGETSDAVAVLFALSQTSEKFRAVLDQIPEPETGEPGVGLNAFMARGTAIFMNKLMGTIQDGAPKEVMDGLKKTIIDANREKEYAVLRKVTSTLDAADGYLSGQLSRAAEGMRTIDAQTKASTASKARKFITSAVTLGTNLLDRPGSELTAQAAQKSVHMGLPILSLVPIRELVDEFVGTNRLNKDFVAMLDVVNTKISGLRQSFREDLPGILNAEFQTQPVKEQWESMHKTLGATDFTRLVNIQNMQRSMQILEESGVRQNRIQAAEAQLQGMLSGSDFSDALDKAKQLADFMNKKGAGKLLVRNAYAIAKNLEGGFVEAAVPVLDELISLYAVDTMDADVRETTVQLWQNEPQAMTAMISYLQSLNEAEDQKAVSEMAKLNGYKGYVPNIGKDNHRVVVALDSAEEEMIHRGFKKMAPFTGDVDSLYPRSYYVTNISHQGMYSQGIMQNVAMTYRGVDVNTGMSVTGDTAGFIYGQDVIERVVETMLDDSFELENNGETLMPVFDEDGAIMGFERSIAPEVAEAFLGRQDNLAVNMGAWAGRQIEEELAYQYNIALVDKLDDLWQNREPGTDKEFVNLKKTNDKIYKESFNLIPVAVKRYMDGKFDGNGMMVPESMVNLSVGYREASIADLWTGKTRMPKELVKGVQAVTRMQLGQTSLRTLLVKGEKAGQSLVSDAKDIIVVKSLVVPLANTQANVIQLANNGVPVKQIVKNYRLKLAEITEFNKNSVKLMQLESKKRLTTDPRQRRLLDDKIKVINDLNARMTIAPMIAAGAYKQLSEGITDIDVASTSGGLAEWMEKQTAKMPDTMAAIAQNAMVSKSTKLYQAANRATQYGDFLAKSIYYDHLLEQGLSKEEAIARMNEEFVNFSFPAGRFRSMLERNGVLWFPSFKIRIAKIAMKQMRENPVRSMALNVPFDFGGPIEDNIFSVIGDGRIDYATGWEMLFAAPELNPWVNLMNG